MGRPRRTEPRNRQLNLSLTESELASLTQRAAAVGLRVAHFGRALVLDEKRRPRSSKNEPDSHARLIYWQLSRLGNLLNQMVRHLHTTGDPLPNDLEPLLADIRRLMTRISP